MAPEHGRRNWHGGDDVVSRPRLYEVTSGLAFLGRRRRTYDDVLDAAQLVAGDRVLDVGTGPGLLARRAARRVGPTGRVVGIDPSPEAVRAASRRRGETLSFEVGTAEDLPFDGQTFDVVVSMLALHHIGDDHLERALAEMSRVLVPGGRLVVADFLAGPRPSRDLLTALAGAGFEPGARGTHAHGIEHVSALKPARTGA